MAVVIVSPMQALMIAVLLLGAIVVWWGPWRSNASTRGIKSVSSSCVRSGFQSRNWLSSGSGALLTDRSGVLFFHHYSAK